MVCKKVFFSHKTRGRKKICSEECREKRKVEYQKLYRGKNRTTRNRLMAYRNTTKIYINRKEDKELLYDFQKCMIRLELIESQLLKRGLIKKGAIE